MLNITRWAIKIQFNITIDKIRRKGNNLYMNYITTKTNRWRKIIATNIHISI